MSVVRGADGGVRTEAGMTIMTQRCPEPRLLFRCEAPRPEPAPPPPEPVPEPAPTQHPLPRPPMRRPLALMGMLAAMAMIAPPPRGR